MIKKLLIIILLLQPAQGLAIDGELYVSKYFNHTNYRAYPDGGEAFTRFGLELGHRFEWWRPYLRWETTTDAYADNNPGYHPASIRYFVGVTLFAYKDSLVCEVEHLCWHPIDRAGEAEEYNMITVRYRWGK